MTDWALLDFQAIVHQTIIEVAREEHQGYCDAQDYLWGQHNFDTRYRALQLIERSKYREEASQSYRSIMRNLIGEE